MAHTLRVAGRREQAVAVYREAQVLFNNDQVLASGLTGILIDLGRADEARAELEWAYQVSDNSEKHTHRFAAPARRYRGRAASALEAHLTSRGKEFG
ncbi:MAG: hypothetical protein KDJ22_14460 [Candidatus Competibacteraceae bacterium]|nr:hypothetical protein [Candidatus Competibacteraceae bacterium]MCB1795845.1 hypothetical protein [Candidatus Competibacteraceae bacterium]